MQETSLQMSKLFGQCAKLRQTVWSEPELRLPVFLADRGKRFLVAAVTIDCGI